MNPYPTWSPNTPDFSARVKYPLGGFHFLRWLRRRAGAPQASFSPHPDDEYIIGGLAIRLQRSRDGTSRNVAVTQAAIVPVRRGRWKELEDACRSRIRTHCHGAQRTGTDHPRPGRRIRKAGRPRWRSLPGFSRTRSPHLPCRMSTTGTEPTVGVHHLVLDALATLPSAFSTAIVETEYWGQMTRPNLMVEVSEGQLADQVTALSFHVGEVQRNPFHLLLPAWMQDNVRRGGELVGGQGRGPRALGLPRCTGFGTGGRPRRGYGGWAKPRVVGCPGVPVSLTICLRPGDPRIHVRGSTARFGPHPGSEVLQLPDGFNHPRRGEIDVLLGGLASESKPKGCAAKAGSSPSAVRTWLEFTAGRIAGGTIGDRDVGQGVQQRFAIDAGKTDAEVVRQSMFPGAVDSQVPDRSRKFCLQAVPQNDETL